MSCQHGYMKIVVQDQQFFKGSLSRHRQPAYCDRGSIFNLFRDPPVGRINITMEKDRESYRGETPFAICQELLSCCYRVAVARSHIKQINLVRGSVCLRPSGFQDLLLPPRLLGSLSRAAWRRIYGRLCSSFILIRRLNENEVAVIAVSRKRDSLNWRAGAL